MEGDLRSRLMSNSSSSDFELLCAAVAVGLGDLQHGADIVLDAQAAKDRGFLRQIADAEPGAAIHRQARDVIAVEFDHALVGFDQPGDHVEDRGLAGAVRAEQADGLAAPDIEAHVLHHPAGLVAFPRW